jgi:regulator of replication initiation timing
MSDDFGISDVGKALSEAMKKTGSFKLNLPEFEMPVHDYELNNIEMPRNPTYDLIEKQEAANKLLSEIVENTSVLKEIVEINRRTQLSAEELNEVLKEIHAVAKADNKNEADGLFKKALNTINTSGETASNVASLVSLLMGIYSTVQPLINN